MRYIILIVFVIYSIAMVFTDNINSHDLYIGVSIILAAEYIDFAFKHKEEE